MPTAGPEGQNTGEMCVNEHTSVSMTTDLCCRNEVKCLEQLKPNTVQPSVSQKIGRGMSAISSEASHPEVWLFLHLPIDQEREESEHRIKSRQESHLSTCYPRKLRPRTQKSVPAWTTMITPAQAA